MNTIAQKITYLNETKQLLKQSLNDLGAKITDEDTFRSYAQKINDIYENWPKVSEKNTNFTLNSTKEGKMKIGLKGNTTQNGTPTPDTPVPVNVVSGDNEINICGKNLFNGETELGTFSTTNGEKTASTNTRRSVNKIPVKPNQQYVFSQNGTAFAVRIYYYQENETFISTEVYTNGIITTPNNCYYVNFISDRISSNYNDIQLEQGNQATTYEPYQSNTYNIDLPVENLFDKSTANLGKGVGTSNGNLYNDSALFATDFIEVKTGGVYYTTSGYSTSANRIYGAQYDSNKQYIGSIVTNAGTKTFYISNASTKYIRLTGFISDIDTYQLEEGSKANSYTPYGTAPIELCKIGDYQDYFYKENDKWYKYGAIGKVVLDGSENWDYNSGNSVFVCSNLINYSLQNFAPYCNNYKGINIVLAYKELNNNEISFLKDSSNNRTLIKDTRYTIASDLQTWLSTHNTMLYYVLATPTITEITDTTLIEQLDNLEKAYSYDTQTNISQENNDKPFILDVTALKKNSSN